MGNIFKPLMFQTEMVQAILDNIKINTRRTKGLEEINQNPDLWEHFFIPTEHNELLFFHFANKQEEKARIIKCPWQIGDILWVRETSIILRDEHLEGREGNIFYKTEELPLTSDFLKECGYKWTPAIHMKKTSCRLFLRVKSVSVERLQDISEEDAHKEGVLFYFEDFTEQNKYLDYVIVESLKPFPIKKGFRFYPWLTAKDSFDSLWKQINGFDSFELNPWVWVIEFERIDKPEDFLNYGNK